MVLRQIEFLPDDNSVGGFLAKQREKFGGGSQIISRVFLVWGLRPQNIEPCSWADLECSGEQGFAPAINFNTNKGGHQADLLVNLSDYHLSPSQRVHEVREHSCSAQSICNKIDRLSASRKLELAIVMESSGAASQDCFIRRFKYFLQNV